MKEFLVHTIRPERFTIGMLYEKVGRDYIITAVEPVESKVYEGVYAVYGEPKKKG